MKTIFQSPTSWSLYLGKSGVGEHWTSIPTSSPPTATTTDTTATHTTQPLVVKSSHWLALEKKKLINYATDLFYFHLQLGTQEAGKYEEYITFIYQSYLQPQQRCGNNLKINLLKCSEFLPTFTSMILS